MDKGKHKRIIITTILIVLALLSTTLYIKVETKPFGYNATPIQSNKDLLKTHDLNLDLMNISIYSYKLPHPIKSKEDFINYLKANSVIYDPTDHTDYLRLTYELGSFMDDNHSVDWQQVAKAITVENYWWKEIYTIE